MSDQPVPNLPPVAPAKSSGSGCLKAAGIGCLVMLILMAVGGYATYRFAVKPIMERVKAEIAKFEQEGYRKIEGQFIEEKEMIKEPTLYMAQSVKLLNGSERGVAMFCQQAEISGVIGGNVYFVGQMLTIHPGTVIMKDLKVQAQVVNQYGEVKGEIQGSYQAMNTTPPAN